jgi:hypothetical protein
MTYQQQLTPWVIYKQLPNLQQSVVYRCRRRHEAEAYLKVLNRHQPSAQFEIVFDVAGRLNAATALKSA